MYKNFPSSCFIVNYRYGDVLALLGRELRDFLNGLDNLHEYLKFSYPRSIGNTIVSEDNV